MTTQAQQDHGRVVCVGDLMVDVVAQLPGPLAADSDTPAVVTLHGGGAAANVAAWLAFGGTPVTYLGRVGDDVAGREAVESLERAGVACAVGVDEERPTGLCIVLVSPDGARTMIPSGGANAGLGAQRFPGLPADTAWLYVSGYALLGPGSRPFAVAALAEARHRGARIAVDAASAAPLASSGTAFADGLGSGLLLFANADEAAVLTGSTDPVTAARALGDRFGAAVVKLGAGGAVDSDGARVPAADVPVVDTTGAGDAFAAGYLAARLGGSGPAGALEHAVQRAGLAIGRIGARPG